MRIQFLCYAVISMLITPSAAFAHGYNSKQLAVYGTSISDLVNEIYKENLILISGIQNLPDKTKRNTICLALNIYHEARSSTEDDQKGVAYVSLNRVQEGNKFGRSVCDVVNQRLSHQTKPQFSWLLLGLNRLIPKEKESWITAQTIAFQAMTSCYQDISHGALYFWNPIRAKPQSWMQTGIEYNWLGSHLYMVVAH